MTSAQTLDFYASHSLTSDPGPLGPMLDELPADIEGLVDVIGGLLVHTATAKELLGEPEPADRGAGDLTVQGMLRRLRAIDPAALGVPRQVEKRLRVNCRNFAMLFVAILRHWGIPARKRVGFDWEGWIHEIAEYWDEIESCWVVVDPDPANRQPIRDFLARTDEAGALFTPGGRAWRLCRAGHAAVGEYRDGDQSGMAGIRVALLQDLDSLNKVELRSWDEWHELMTTPWDELDGRSLAWLDQAAAYTEEENADGTELRAFYATSGYGAAVRTRLAQLVA